MADLAVGFANASPSPNPRAGPPHQLHSWPAEFLRGCAVATGPYPGALHISAGTHRSEDPTSAVFHRCSHSPKLPRLPPRPLHGLSPDAPTGSERAPRGGNPK